VWNRDMAIAWSDEPRLVGQRFPNDEEVKKALGGTLASAVNHFEGVENRYERQYSHLMEIYVPIRRGADGKVDTVFEIYQDADALYADLGRIRDLLWAMILSGFGVVFVGCLGLVWSASRKTDAVTREVRESEAKYHGLIRSAPDGIVGVGPDGNIVLFNEGAERMFGYTTGDVLGKPVAMLMPEEHRKTYWENLLRVVEEGPFSSQGKVREYEGLHRDGRTFPVEFSLSVCGSGPTVMFTGLMRDISDRKAMQEQLLVSEKQALAATIAGSIGHEINNSLTGVVGYTELLLENHRKSVV